MTEANTPQSIQPAGPIVTIIGRPNVGKSTLFNRLIRRRTAITDDRPGITRDRIYAEIEWAGRSFTLVDTGGYLPETRDVIEAAIREQVEVALRESDLILLLVDAATGVTDLDQKVARMVRRQGAGALVLVNKVDNSSLEPAVGEFSTLGLGEAHPVSAATGRRTGDLLDLVLERIGERAAPADEEDDLVRIAVIGRPNVGKSTLVNRLGGTQVSIVHELPGTTRDTTSIRVEWNGSRFELLDTAGQRRRSRVEDPVEYYSTLRSQGTVARADAALLLLDAAEGCTSQDARIISQVIEAGCAMVVAVNKWDLIDDATTKAAEFRADLQHKFPFLQHYPILFISGLTGKRVSRCLEAIAKVADSRGHRVSTSQLNQLFDAINQRNPPTSGGKQINLLYATQHGVRPPTFVIFTNRPDLVSASYRRFVENRLRDRFCFEGTPIRTIWRKR